MTWLILVNTDGNNTKTDKLEPSEKWKNWVKITAVDEQDQNAFRKVMKMNDYFQQKRNVSMII